MTVPGPVASGTAAPGAPGPGAPAPFAPPEWPSGGGAPGAGPGFAPGVPLGGVAPAPVTVEEPSNRRELLFIGLLLVGAVVAALSSLLSWRDYGRVVISTTKETGWVLPDGSMGRGWIAVAIGVVLAVAGVLVASDRQRAGRVLATLGGVGLILLAIGEWGLGAGELRTGPGAGIWLMLVLGVLVVVGVGTLGIPPNTDT